MENNKINPLSIFAEDLSSSLRLRTRFSVSKKLEKQVNEFVDYHLSVAAREITKETLLYRARIHDVNQRAKYSVADMGFPKVGSQRAGRINPEGIRCLYLADSTETALAEVRPWKGASVSVGTFVITRNVKAVDLSIGLGPIPKKLSDGERESTVKAFEAAHWRSQYFSAPVHNEDRLSYLASQYISEKFRERGIEVLMYKSVLFEGGINYAAFAVKCAACKDVSVYSVRSVKYESTRAGA